MKRLALGILAGLLCVSFAVAQESTSSTPAPTGITSEPDPAAKSLTESPLRRGERRAQPGPAAVGGKARGGLRRPYDFRESSNYKALDAGARQSLETVHRDFTLLWGALDMYIREHNNRAPENLEALVPRYLKELPKDPFATDKTAAQKDPGYKIRSLNGWGYWYRQGSGDAFIIYSVGLPDFPYLAESGNVGLYLARGNWVSGINVSGADSSTTRKTIATDTDAAAAALAVAKAQLDRTERLHARGYVSELQLKADQLEFEKARQHLERVRAMQKTPDAKAETEDVSKAKLLNRRDTIRQLVKLVEEECRERHSSVDTVIHAYDQLLNAELDLATERNQRVAIMELQVKRLADLEQTALALFDAGHATQESVLAVKLAILHTHIQLMQEADAEPAKRFQIHELQIKLLTDAQRIAERRYQAGDLKLQDLLKVTAARLNAEIALRKELDGNQ